MQVQVRPALTVETVLVVALEAWELRAARVPAIRQFKVQMVVQVVQVEPLQPHTTALNPQLADQEDQAEKVELVIQTQAPIQVIVVLLSIV